MPLLDTRSSTNSLVGKFISDIVLQVLSFVAENERETTRKRQTEGIAIAKAKGVKFGRPCKQLTEKFFQAVEMYNAKSVTVNEAAKIAGMTRQNFYYHIHKLNLDNSSKN